MRSSPEIIVTKQDMERLASLVATAATSQAAAAERLDHELGRARVVDAEAIPHDVVTMNSRIVYENLETGVRRELTLAYPEDANIDARRVSVLVPVGSALLGLRVGQEIEWPVPHNRTTRIRIVSVSYQPEAMGEHAAERGA